MAHKQLILGTLYTYICLGINILYIYTNSTKIYNPFIYTKFVYKHIYEIHLLSLFLLIYMCFRSYLHPLFTSTFIDLYIYIYIIIYYKFIFIYIYIYTRINLFLIFNN